MMFVPHTPYKQYVMPMFIIHASDRQVGLISEIGDVWLTSLESLVTSKRVIYSCVTPDTLLLYGSDSLWTVNTWNGKVSSMNYGGVKIYPLEMSYHDSIWDFFQLLDSLGIAASGLNRMALNLWRVSLDYSVDFTETPNEYGRYLGLDSVAVGGRKEAIPGKYYRRVEYDISAAYPNALGIGIPTRLTQYRGPVRTGLDSSWDGIAHARVRIPARDWGPLPITLDKATQLTCYGYTGISRWVNVTLPLSELRMAERVGCDIKLLDVSIAMPSERNVFSTWISEVVPALRTLNSHAGILGKLVANRLWSNFAVTPFGDRRETRFAGGQSITTQMPADHPSIIRQRSQVAYVGAFVQSRVRQKVYDEGLRYFPDCVYIDTDGIIAKRVDSVPAGWRIKEEMRSLEIAGPQAYTYKCPECHAPPGGHSGPHWCVAGASTVQEKSRLFKLMKNNGIVMANINNVVPNQDVSNFDSKTQANRSEAFSILAGT